MRIPLRQVRISPLIVAVDIEPTLDALDSLITDASDSTCSDVISRRGDEPCGRTATHRLACGAIVCGIHAKSNARIYGQGCRPLQKDR